MPDITTIYFVSSTLLILFALVGAFDGIYFHLYVYRLQDHPESRLEHWIHTVRAFVFTVLAGLLYVVNAGGLLLYAAIGVLALDLVLETIDVLVEKKARAKLGGISSAESAVHVLATGLKTASLALILIAKPAGAWEVGAPLLLTPYPVYVVTVGMAFGLGTLLGGIGQVFAMKPLHQLGGATQLVPQLSKNES